MSETTINNYGTQIAQIKIVTGRQSRYENGFFLAVFQRELAALVQDTELKLNDYRILLLMMAYVDNNNCITISIKEITTCLGCAPSTVYRTLRKLQKMRVIWAHLQSSVFKLSKDLIDSIHEEGIVAYTS
ncbi:MAG: hypothetical protein IJK05_08725 [Bacteroidales bacterium]|nr:hypothetical protein [Bacteroidales bacterium]